MVAAEQIQAEEIRHPLDIARSIAESLVALMQPHCERIEIGGSIRRQRETVKDIELVLIPKASWFAFTDELLASGFFTKRHGWGERNRFAVHVESGIWVDMFVADATAWGSAFMIRTGPGELNTRLMTWCKQNRTPVRMRDHYHWWHGDRRLLILEEQDAFDMLGIPFIPPQERTLPRYANLLNDPAREWPDFSRWYEPETPIETTVDLFASAGVSTATLSILPIDLDVLKVSQERYAAIRQIERETVQQYEAQKPPKLLTMPQIKERCEHMELVATLKRWALRLPLWWPCEAGWYWAIAAGNWPHFQPEVDDFEALFWMQWGEAGAKTYAEIAEENAERYRGYMAECNARYSHLSQHCWWHQRFGQEPRKGDVIVNLDIEGKLQLKAEHFAGQRVVILGQSGAGKTNTSGVWIEEMLPHMPMTILDIEGEHWGLAANHDLLIVGRSEHSALDVPISQAGRLAEFVYRHKLSIILDMSDHDEMEMHQFVLEYFEALWDCAFKVPVQDKQPYGVVIEECQEFIPQSRTTASKDLFKRYAKRGRKQGFTLVMTSQESQDVDKRVITQANIAFLHRVTHPNDKAIYVKYIPWKPAAVAETVAELQPGQAVVVHSGATVTVQIRKRHAFHAGRTPTLNTHAQSESPALRMIDEALLGELRQALGTTQEMPSAAAQQAVRVVELENENRQLQQRNAELEAIIAGLEGVAEKLTVTPATVEMEPIAETAPVPGEEPYRSPTVIARARSAQERNYQRLREIVASQTKADRIALLYLHDNAGQWYSVETIARHTKYSPKTFRLNDLIKIGLVKRQKTGSTFCYQSTVEKKLMVDCGDLDVSELAARLVKV